MISSNVIECCDPYELIRQIRPDGQQILVTERGIYHARAVSIDFGMLYLQKCHENLARIIRTPHTNPGLIFLTEPGPSVFIDGVEVNSEQIVLVAAGHTHITRTIGPTCYGTLTLAGPSLEAISQTCVGDDRVWSIGCTIIEPPAQSLARLRAVHAAAVDLAGGANSFSRNVESGFEQALLQAMFNCIESSVVVPQSIASQHHRATIDRFFEICTANSSTHMIIPELGRALGVSGRTLRSACQSQLGLSPTQYIQLWRMHQARRKLQQANPELESVTDIATALGFWELGRFSVGYRALFGESPSETLRARSQRNFQILMPLDCTAD